MQYDEPGRVDTMYAEERWSNKVEGNNTVRGPYDAEEAALKEASDAARSGAQPGHRGQQHQPDEPNRAAAERAIDPST